MLELILGILLAAGATYFVLRPILRPAVEAAGNEPAGDEGEDPADDMSPQTVALRALKEIEFDRATGKLSDTDYEHLKAKYTEQALIALRGAGALPPGASPGIQEPRAVARGQKTPGLTCPEHGARRRVLLGMRKAVGVGARLLRALRLGTRRRCPLL